jgi:DUF4097 and DUF4098 domain-containing protein YvlB
MGGCLIKDEDFDVFSEDFDTLSWEVDNISKIEVSTVTGNISISKHDENSIDAILYKRSWGLNFQDAENHLSDIKILQSQSGNTFSLAAEIPDVNRKYIASFALETPDSLFLDFFIINGDLMSENMASDAKFRVSNGGVETELMQGDLDIEVINGGISIVDHEGEVKAEISAGSIYCRMLELSPGEIIDLRTGTGTVTLELPASSSFTFEISTRTGKLNIYGFDEITYDRQELYYRQGKVNGGESTVNIHCITGGITIQAI